jgi:bis(5'-nucleosyl)-tetraphosphatase (symmetrical)
MASYAIGDIQGCYRTLERLLRRIRFDPEADRLWLVGDLVNRGPRSLEVLRWARSLGTRHRVVLGNHDLHLIGRALGLRREKARDTLDEVLEAEDRDELIGWLRRQPFVQYEAPLLMVHAGLLPQWSADDALDLAAEAQFLLRGDDPRDVFQALRQEPGRWRPGLPRRERLAHAVQAFTTLRACSPDGRPCDGFSGPPEQAPRGCVPWFEAPGRRAAQTTVVCGHWAALGLRVRPNLLALDTACVWGGSLTAVRLEDRVVFQEKYAED